MTFKVILNLIKNVCILNVSIHINFYENQFINECARKKKAKILEFQSFLLDVEDLTFLIVKIVYLKE